MDESGKKRILLVEDEAIIAMIEARELRREGYLVIHAGDGEKAIAAVRGASPPIDLVLMDIDLGEGMDGTEAAEEILRTHKVPVVFLSSHTERNIVEKTEKITSYGYVLKNSGMFVLDASIKMAFRLFEARQFQQRHQGESPACGKDALPGAMLANIGDVIGIMAADGIMKYKSPNIEGLFGWKPEDLVGTDGWDTVHPGDIERIRTAFAALVSQDKAKATVEYRYKHKDGSYSWIELTAVNSLGDPDIEGIVLNYHDISARKRGEAALRESEERLHLALEAAKAGTWEWSLDTNENLWSEELWRLYGLDPHCVPSSYEAWLGSIMPEDRAGAEMAVAEAVRNGGELNVEWRVRDADGTIRWNMSRGKPIRDSSGRVRSYLGIVIDITERKRSEEALRESEERYSLTLSAVMDGFWDWHVPSGRAFFSPLYYALLGFEDGEFPANYESWRLLVHPEDLERVEEELLRCTTRGKGFSIDFRMRTGNGSWLWVCTRGNAVKQDAAGKALRMLGTLSDISQRVLAEEENRRLLREKEIILKEVHHRVKNNINTIMSLLAIQARFQDSPDASAVLMSAAGRLQSMKVLYDKLYRSENESAISVRDYLPALMAEILAIFPNGHEVRLRTRIEDIVMSTRILSVLGILLNELMTNAMKHAFTGRQDAEISLELAKVGNRVSILFADNGLGMPEASSVEKSAGFGLQLVGMLVRQIDGSISSAGRGGTSYRIEFRD